MTAAFDVLLNDAYPLGLGLYGGSVPFSRLCHVIIFFPTPSLALSYHNEQNNSSQN